MPCCSDGGRAQELVLSSKDLLQHIFCELELVDLLQSVPLVCRAWRDAQASPGSCWDVLEIDGLRLTKGPPMAADAAAHFWRTLAEWLPRRAGGLRKLRLANLRYLLQELEDAGRLAALSQLWRALGGGGGKACAAPAARALRALEVGRSPVGLVPGTVAAMARLPQLRVLRLHTASPLDFAELDSLADGLPDLEQLHVCLMRRRGEVCAFRGAFPARLAGLRRLRSLRLEAPHSPLNAPSCMLPDRLDGWDQQLEELHLINLGLEALPDSLGTLRALRELCLARNRLGMRPAALPWSLTQLTSLTRLELQYNGFASGPPPLVGELPSLLELNLSGNLWGSACSDLPPEYAQLTQLRYLTLTNCELSALPPTVRCLPSLTLLKLNINKIKTLPAGPYLRQLECIDLSHNSFTTGYPRALAGATRLQFLSFQHDGRHYSDPAAALRCALAPLPPAGEQPPQPASSAGAAAPVPGVAAAALPPAHGI